MSSKINCHSFFSFSKEMQLAFKSPHSMLPYICFFFCVSTYFLPQFPLTVMPLLGQRKGKRRPVPRLLRYNSVIERNVPGLCKLFHSWKHSLERQFSMHSSQNYYPVTLKHGFDRLNVLFLHFKGFSHCQNMVALKWSLSREILEFSKHLFI